MQGTPWHVEILTKDKDDNRRIKNACQYYKNGKCIKLENTCYGSAKCEFYIENPNYQRSIKKVKDKYKSDNYNQTKYMVGKFTIEYQAGTRKQVTLGEDIQREDPYVKVVINTKIKNNFYFKGEEVKLIMRKIRPNLEIRTRNMNTFVNKLRTKELIKNKENKTNIEKFSSKIQFTVNGFKFMFRAGKNLAWDDPLINTILNSPQNKPITVNGIEFIIISKYISYKQE